MLKATLDAFSGMRSEPLIPPITGDRVDFTSVYVSSASNFDGLSLSVNCRSNCFYWMHIAIDVGPNTLVTLQLKGNDANMTIYKSISSLAGINTLTRSGIVQINRNVQLWLVSSYGSSGTGVRQPYWSGFRLDNVFSDLILFSLLQTSSDSIPMQAYIPINYDKVSPVKQLSSLQNTRLLHMLT